MKKLMQTALLGSLPLFGFAADDLTTNSIVHMRPCTIPTGPHATFSKQWVDYDIYEDGSKGMRIHLKFTTYEMKEMDSYVAVYFQDDYGNKLKDKNQKFYSTSGDVAVYKTLNPCCEATDYDDMQIFMPYDELDLGGGKYNLTMDVDVIYKQ